MTRPQHPMLLSGGGAWAGVAGAWTAHAAAQGSAPIAAVALCLVVAVLLAVAGLRGSAAAALIGVGLAAGAAAASGYLASSRPPQLQAWAAERAEVVLQGRVVSAGLDVARGGPAGRSRVVVSVLAIGQDGTGQRIRAGAVLLGDGDVLGAPERGSTLLVQGTVLPLDLWRDPGAAVAVDRVLDRSPPAGWAGLVAHARADLWRSLERIDADAASLVAGLAIGDDSRQSASLEAAMRASGLSHLTAVSGGNLAIVAAVVTGVAARIGAPLALRIATGIAAIAGYAAFVGPEPSVLRAAVMGGVALAGLARSTRRSGLPLLGLAVLVLIILRPPLALSWGFALSVAATAGILALAPVLDQALVRRLPLLPAVVLTALAVTLAAQVATAPLLAVMTGTVSPVAVPANLLAAPLVAPITLLGLALVLAASVAPSVATLVAVGAEPFAGLLARIARWGESVPGGTIAVQPGPGALVLGALALVLALALHRRGRTGAGQGPATSPWRRSVP